MQTLAPLILSCFLVGLTFGSSKTSVFSVNRMEARQKASQLLQEPKTIAMIPFLGRSHVDFALDIAVELRKRGHNVCFIVPRKFCSQVEDQGFHVKAIVNVSVDNIDERFIEDIAMKDKGYHQLPLLKPWRDNVTALGKQWIRAVNQIRPDVVVYDRQTTAIGTNIFVKNTNVTLVELNLIRDPAFYVALFCESLQENRLLCFTKSIFKLALNCLYYGVNPFEELGSLLVPHHPVSINAQFPGYNFPYQTYIPVTSVLFGLTVAPFNVSRSKDGSNLRLKNWLDSLADECNVIYMSFASVVRQPFSSETIAAIFKGIVSIGKGLRIVASLQKSYQDDVRKSMELRKIPGSKIYISSSVYHQMILLHPKTVLFISDGGQRSMAEAMASQIPVLVIPIYFDHFMHALLVERVGMGLWIKKTEITENTVKEKATTIFKNYHKFASAVVAVNRLRMLAGGAPRAVDLIEASMLEYFSPVDALLTETSVYSVFFWSLAMSLAVVFLCRWVWKKV